MIWAASPFRRSRPESTAILPGLPRRWRRTRSLPSSPPIPSRFDRILFCCFSPDVTQVYGEAIRQAAA
jgi:hypothetical protein